MATENESLSLAFLREEVGRLRIRLEAVHRASDNYSEIYRQSIEQFHDLLRKDFDNWRVDIEKRMKTVEDRLEKAAEAFNRLKEEFLEQQNG